jgi:hypothetical protein
MNITRILPWVVIVAGLALIAAAIIPNFVGRGRLPKRNSCVNTLRWIDGLRAFP